MVPFAPCIPHRAQLPVLLVTQLPVPVPAPLVTCWYAGCRVLLTAGSDWSVKDKVGIPSMHRRAPLLATAATHHWCTNVHLLLATAAGLPMCTNVYQRALCLTSSSAV